MILTNAIISDLKKNTCYSKEKMDGYMYREKYKRGKEQFENSSINNKTPPCKLWRTNQQGGAPSIIPLLRRNYFNPNVYLNSLQE